MLDSKFWGGTGEVWKQAAGCGFPAWGVQKGTAVLRRALRSLSSTGCIRPTRIDQLICSMLRALLLLHTLVGGRKWLRSCFDTPEMGNFPGSMRYLWGLPCVAYDVILLRHSSWKRINFSHCWGVRHTPGLTFVWGTYLPECPHIHPVNSCALCSHCTCPAESLGACTAELYLPCPIVKDRIQKPCKISPLFTGTIPTVTFTPTEE